MPSQFTWMCFPFFFFLLPACLYKTHGLSQVQIITFLFLCIFIGTVSLLSARAIRSWLHLLVIHHFLKALVCCWKVSMLLTECYNFPSFSNLYQTCIFIQMSWAASSAVWRAASWGRADLWWEQWIYHIKHSWEFSSWQMPGDGSLEEGWHSCGSAPSELTNEEHLSGQRRNSDQRE